MLAFHGIGTPGFGALSIGTLAFLAVLTAAAIWVARHEGLASRRWERVRDAAVVRRAAAWARARVGAGRWSHRLPAYEVAGIALLAGSAVVVALAAGFTAILEDVLEGDGIAGIDQPAAGWIAAHRDPWLTTALRLATDAGGAAPLAALAALACAAAVWRCRSWLPVLLAVVGVGGIALVIVVAKVLVIRNRPHASVAVLAEDGYSFPSGHAAGTSAIALFSAWLLTRWLITSWPGRVLVWAVAIGLTAVIGFSRVYLGVHYVSDVAAGWLLGAAWAGIVMLVGSWFDNARRPRTLGPAASGGRPAAG